MYFQKPAKAAPQSKKTATLKNATPAATKKDESSDSSDSDSGSDDSDEVWHCCIFHYH